MFCPKAAKDHEDPPEESSKGIASLNFIRSNRGGGSTGAAGAFAPVNFWHLVHCTRPDKELSYKWPFFSQKRSFFSPKTTFLVQKMWHIFKFQGCEITPSHLKSFTHPFCQVLGAAPVETMEIGQENEQRQPILLRQRLR